MKKNKIIGLSVAILGTAVSVGTAAALYVKKADDAHFGIGAKWSGLDGTVTYKINDATSGTATASYLKANGTNGGEGLGGEYTQVHYSFPLGASFSADVPAQNFVVGNFKVELSNINAALQGNSVIWVCVNGYTENSWGAVNYGTCFMDSDTALTEATYSVNHDIAVSASKAQTVDVYIKLNSAIDDLLGASPLAETKPFDISVSWGAPTNFEFAHVVGNGTMWEADDVYAMVPNINKANSEGFEWVFNNLPGTMGHAKAKKGDTWSADPDAELDATKTYDVYWSGDGAVKANFVAQGE